MSKGKPRHSSLRRIRQAFDREELRRICQMPERDFGTEFGLERYEVAQKAPSNYYYFRDNGAKVLAVAHLDTVGRPESRACRFVRTESGLVVYSRALDDRLGAYIILDLLPKLGLTYDLLLTVGEETGESTASFFNPAKDYDWIIEFDRGGTDVVMYQYDDRATRELVLDSGARVGEGIFSDICYLDHLGCKGFNWGVGYRDYHSARSHAFLDDTFMMVDQFMAFQAANAGTWLQHDDTFGVWWTKAANTEQDALDDELEPETTLEEDDEAAEFADLLDQRWG